MIRVWQSYSCNNSGAYRLVARFASAELAREVAGELEEFFVAHAAEVDADNDSDDIPTRAQLELASRHGFTWTHRFSPTGRPDDAPALVVHDSALVVHHYNGSFGDLLAYFEQRGATVDHQQGSTISVTVLFRPPADADFETDLSIMFQLFVPADPDDQQIDELLIPWKEDHSVEGSVAWFRDPSTVAFHVPIHPRDLAHLKQWLADRRVERPVIQIGDTSNLTRLRAIARARCASCGGALEYLDPRLHDIETPQLVCRPCGGFYDLETFT